jgi:hypothetical protein
MGVYTGSYTSTVVITQPSGTLLNNGTAGTGIISVSSGIDLDATTPPQSITNQGSIYNASSANADIGVALQAGDSFFNKGLVQGGGIGVDLVGGGYVYNAPNGYIRGNDKYGLLVTGAAGTLVNAYRIVVSGAYGVLLQAGGAITNAINSEVAGHTYGIRIAGAAGVVDTDGFVFATTDAIGLLFGSVTNRASGDISSYRYDISFAGSGTVVNSGTISHPGANTANVRGIAIGAAGSVTNQSGGTISAAAFSVSIAGAGYVTNSGSITGGLQLAGGGTIFNQTSASILGINDQAIAIASGASSGSLTNLGTIFAGVVSVNTGTIRNLGSLSLIHGNDVAVSITNGLLANGGSIVAVGSGGQGDAVDAVNSDVLNTLSGARSVITGAVNGVVLSGTQEGLKNSGTIAGGVLAISLAGSGYVTNLASGYIQGGSTGGIQIAPNAGGNTIQNYGIIHGGGTGVSAIGNGSGSLTVYNHSGALLTGAPAITAAGAALVENAGSIAGDVSLSGGGRLLNSASGRISFSLTDGAVMGGAGTIDNSGSIRGNTDGAVLQAGGFITNEAGGYIYGTTAVAAAGVNASITNFGTVQEAFSGPAVLATDAGFYLKNASAGLINGDVSLQAGGKVLNLSTTGGIMGSVVLGATGSVGNTGVINDSFNGTGIVLQAAGHVSNGIGASIIGGYGVTVAGNNATVQNYGTITGLFGTAVKFTGSNDTLQLAPFETISGIASGGGSGMLELQSFAAAGTISNIGASYVAFGTVQVDGGATWTLAGQNTIANGVSFIVQAGAAVTNTGTLTLSGAGGQFASGQQFQNSGLFDLINANLIDQGTLLNNGTVVIDPSTLTVAGLVGTGQVSIGASGTLTSTGTVSSGETITFAGTSGVLNIDSPGSFSGVIDGFTNGETIGFGSGTTVSSGTILPGNTLQVTLSNGGTFDFQLNPSQSFNGSTLTITSGQLSLACFRAGTHIMTEDGPCAVEDLRVGDRVPTQLHGDPLPIIWIGHRTIDCRRHPMPARVWPIRVAAHAFGPSMPQRDLYLSPDHAVFVNDVLIPVKHLVNGGTVAQVPVDEATYYHIELPQHDVVLAEGLPTESYLETGDRANFANGGSVARLHPDLTARAWEALGCAPLVVSGPELMAARAMLGDLATLATAA